MKLGSNIKKEVGLFFTLNSTNRKWQVPLLAATCVGTPLLTGLYFQNLRYGLIACLGGLAILSLPATGSITKRIMSLLLHSFGFMVSFAFGQIFSFDPIVSVIALGAYAMVVHWIMLYYNAPPPRSFFFIFIASMSICQPFSLDTIPTKVGLIGLGTMYSCILALIYMFGSRQKEISDTDSSTETFSKNIYANYWESIITGGFMAVALASGYLLKIDNPYWIPVSTAAVMQGASLYHIRQRTVYRILGTFVGLGVCWALLNVIHTPLLICISIILLQFIVEMLIVRHYALAVIFITPMAILLTEASSPLINDPNELISLRFWEICIGSIVGAIGGWLLYKEKIRYTSIRGIEKITEGIRKSK